MLRKGQLGAVSFLQEPNQAMPAASLFPNRFAKPMVHVFFNPLYQSRLLLRFFWPTEAPRQHDGVVRRKGGRCVDAVGLLRKT